VLSTDNDITARKQAEELMKSEARRLDALVEQRTARLQETIGELEAFSYSISHDMRAPLRAMQGYAKALLADYKDRLDPDAMQYLDRISRSANRLDSLIQDVLAYSRVAKGEIGLHPVDLEALIEDILSTRPEFQAPQARIVVEKPLHRVFGHEAYLTQCLTNLLGNAVKFVPAGVVPDVRVRSERLDGKVRLLFEDNGVGIDPSHHERIFQIFGQVYPEKKYGGTGIGLAIVRKAVQRMNGEVGVESGLDKGSRFWLILNEVKYDN
jgi:signal transduction histidine kinase